MGRNRPSWHHRSLLSLVCLLLSLHHLLVVCLLGVVLLLLVLRVHSHLSLLISIVHHIIVRVHLLGSSWPSWHTSSHTAHHLRLWIRHHHLLVLHSGHRWHTLHHHPRRHTLRHPLLLHSWRERIISRWHRVSILLISPFIHLLTSSTSVVLIR
jgi:hypothetical protein